MNNFIEISVKDSKVENYLKMTLLPIICYTGRTTSHYIAD